MDSAAVQQGPLRKGCSHLYGQPARASSEQPVEGIAHPQLPQGSCWSSAVCQRGIARHNNAGCSQMAGSAATKHGRYARKPTDSAEDEDTDGPKLPQTGRGVSGSPLGWRRLSVCCCESSSGVLGVSTGRCRWYWSAQLHLSRGQLQQRVSVASLWMVCAGHRLGVALDFARFR